MDSHFKFCQNRHKSQLIRQVAGEADRLENSTEKFSEETQLKNRKSGQVSGAEGNRP